MPEGINEGTIKAAEALIKDPEGVVKGAEAAASKAEETIQNARTYARDARGRFASAVKSATKTATAAGAGAEAASLFDNKSNNGNDSDNASTQPGASKTKSVPNPGANSPAGRIDLPSITPAEDIASGVDPSSFSDTRGVKGSWGDAGGENLSNRKLNRIITLLESILSVEKNNTKLMGQGFYESIEATYKLYNLQVRSGQLQDMEKTSSGKGSFIESFIKNPGKTAVGGLKSLGAAVLGSFALGALIEGAKNMEGDDAKGHPVQDTADHDKVFGTYKDKYGKRWAAMFIDDIEEQLSKKKGFQQDLADSKQAAAGDIYLAIKNLFDKSSKEDQSKLIQQIAYLLKLKPEQVQAQIVEVNKPSRQIGRTVSQAVSNALVNSATWGTTQAQKAAGFVGGGALIDLGQLANFSGYKKIGNYLQQKGGDLAENEVQSAHQAQAQMKHYLRENTSMETQYDIGRHQDAYKFTTAGTDAAEAIIGPGKLGFGKLLFGAGVGGLGMFGGEGKHDIFAYARQGDIHFDGEGSKTVHGRKLTPEAAARAKKAVAFFQSKGWSKEQAEGLVDNLLVESNYTLDPHQGQIGGGGGYGIAQWTSKDRKKQFASTEGVSLEHSTFEQQLDFVNWELNHTEKNAGNKLRNSNTISDASKVVTRYYERPKEVDQQSEFRAAYGEALFKQFDTESLKPQTQIASAAPVSSPVMINQGGTNISRNTTIQNASAAAPPWLQDNVMASFG